MDFGCQTETLPFALGTRLYKPPTNPPSSSFLYAFQDPSPNTLPFDAPHLHPPLVGPPVSEVAELDLRYGKRIL